MDGRGVQLVGDSEGVRRKPGPRFGSVCGPRRGGFRLGVFTQHVLAGCGRLLTGGTRRLIFLLGSRWLIFVRYLFAQRGRRLILMPCTGPRRVLLRSVFVLDSGHGISLAMLTNLPYGGNPNDRKRSEF